MDELRNGIMFDFYLGLPQVIPYPDVYFMVIASYLSVIIVRVMCDHQVDVRNGDKFMQAFMMCILLVVGTFPLTTSYLQPIKIKVVPTKDKRRLYINLIKRVLINL